MHRLLCRDPRRVAYQYHCRSNVPNNFGAWDSEAPVPQMWEQEGFRCAASCLRGDI